MAANILSTKFPAQALAFALCAGLGHGLWAAETPAAPTAVSPTAKAVSPAAKAATPAKPEEALFFTVSAGQRQVLGRTDAEGSCKAYLGKPGAGWMPYADPKTAGDDHQAVSSPDGQRLALLSSRNGAVNLWLLSADALEWRQVTDDDAGIMSPQEAQGPVLAFSPDSKQLALIRRGALWLLSLDGEQPRTLSTKRGVSALAWSPDSRWLAYLAGSSLRKVEATGAPDILLSSNVADQPSLAWHPDAKQELLYFLGKGLRKVDARRRSTLLAPSSSRPNSLAVLPSGKQVALLAPSVGGHSDVFMATLGDKAVKLERVTQDGAEAVVASAGGKALYFVRNGVAWRCDLNGLKAKPLGTVKMGALRVGSLPPLKGVCP
jgi:Tol biopolymer transport system component